MTQLASRPRTTTASRRARQRLLEQLGQQWRVGDRLPPLRELAQQLNIAPGTAHRAVSMLADDGFLEARPRQGIFVTDRFTDGQLRALSQADDQPKGDALVGKRIKLIHNIDARDHFVSRMADIVAEGVVAQGGRVERMLRAGGSDQTTVNLADADADAFVAFNLVADTRLKLAEDRPTLVVSTAVPYPPDRFSHCDIVTVDQEQGGVIAGRTLRDAGCQRVCFIGKVGREGAPLDPTSAARLHGFEHGYGAQNIKTIHAEWYGLITGARAAGEYLKLKDRPDGIFAASDELAVGFINGAAAHGLVAGQDYQIVGFDGQDIARTLDGGSLTTIEVPTMQMAQRAAEVLVSRFQSPARPSQRVLLGCTLLKGRTVQHVSTAMGKEG